MSFANVEALYNPYIYNIVGISGSFKSVFGKVLNYPSEIMLINHQFFSEGSAFLEIGIETKDICGVGQTYQWCKGIPYISIYDKYLGGYAEWSYPIYEFAGDNIFYEFIVKDNILNWRIRDLTLGIKKTGTWTYDDRTITNINAIYGLTQTYYQDQLQSHLSGNSTIDYTVDIDDIKNYALSSYYYNAKTPNIGGLVQLSIDHLYGQKILFGHDIGIVYCDLPNVDLIVQ